MAGPRDREADEQPPLAPGRPGRRASSPRGRGARLAPSGPEAPSPALGVTAVAAATIIGLEEIRVFLSYLVWGLGDSTDRVALGAIAAAPFALVAGAAVFLRSVGPRAGLVLAAVWLSVAYLAEHTSNVARLDAALAGLCVLLWGWLVAAALVTLRRGVGLGLVVGSSLDLALRLGLLTLDVPWIDHPIGTGVAVLLAGCAMVGSRLAATRVLETGEPDVPSLAPLVAVGPWLALTLLITGNPPQVAARLGSSYGAVVGALAVGHAAGLSLASGMLARPVMSAGLAVLGIVGALALFPLWNGWALGALWAGISSASTSLMLAGSLRSAEQPATRGSAAATSVFLAVGLLVFLALAYSAYALSEGFPWALLAALGLACCTFGSGVVMLPRAEARPVDVSWLARGGAGIVVALGLMRVVTWSEPVAAEIAPRELTVMTYNVRAGFGSDDRWDLERTARTIEREQPDVVVLQEISRGWLIATGADEALWLGQRLGMQGIFGAAAGDLHGNLILSRYRADGRSYRYEARAPGALQRGAVEAVVATERGPLLVLGTHFDRGEDAVGVRRAQTGELLWVAASRMPALLVGDFNAEASAPELSMILASGFIDGPASLGVTDRTWRAPDPKWRIDHVFASPSLQVLESHVGSAEASDHLPVVVRVRVV